MWPKIKQSSSPNQETKKKYKPSSKMPSSYHIVQSSRQLVVNTKNHRAEHLAWGLGRKKEHQVISGAEKVGEDC